MTSAENRRGEGRGQQQYSSSSGAAVLRQQVASSSILCVEVSSDDKDPTLQKGALLRYLHLRRLVKVPAGQQSIPRRDRIGCLARG